MKFQLSIFVKRENSRTSTGILVCAIFVEVKIQMWGYLKSIEVKFNMKQIVVEPISKLAEFLSAINADGHELFTALIKINSINTNLF